jgi:hypothetical protein
MFTLLASLASPKTQESHQSGATPKSRGPTMSCASRLGLVWSPLTAPAGGWGRNGCSLASCAGRPTGATGSATKVAHAICGSTWRSVGACRAICSVVTIPSRQMSPGNGSASGSRESFKDSKSRFRLKRVQIASPERLTRLLLALTIALCWLALAALRGTARFRLVGMPPSLNGAAPASSAWPWPCLKRFATSPSGGYCPATEKHS